MELHRDCEKCMCQGSSCPGKSVEEFIDDLECVVAIYKSNVLDLKLCLTEAIGILRKAQPKSAIADKFERVLKGGPYES